MSIKVRLIIMNFLQFFVWGSWLISLGGYMGRELHFEGGQIGAIFATMGIASLVMPGIIGIIADKWFNAERLYGLCHIIGAACLFYASIRPDVLGHVTQPVGIYAHFIPRQHGIVQCTGAIQM